RWRPRDDGPRRRRGRRTRERVLLQAVRGRRVRRCAPTRAPPLSRGWRAVGGTPYPSDARGSLVDRIGQAICRDVFGRGEGQEGALFNELRARGPAEVKGADEVRETIERSRGDPFCHPETGTPADTFGRVKGAHGITASNVAKYDAYHGVLVFDDHDPLATMDAGVIRDRLVTARRWAERVNEEDPAARYYFLLWNCLWRAGGSIVHGHMQMTVTAGMHYPKVELLRRRSLAYDEQHGRDYFDDLWLVHEALELGDERDGARVFASLAPVKERAASAVAAGDPARLAEVIRS